MPRTATVALSFVTLALLLMVQGTREANAGSKLPDPGNAGVAERLYRLDCGRSLANDESVWTPGENVGRSIEFSSTCWLVKHGREWLLWDTGVPEATLNDPRGWSTLPKLIVYHLDKSLTDQLAEIGLKPERHRSCRNIAYAWRPHRQRGLVPRLHNCDAASRVQLDTFPRRAERQRKSIDGAGAQALGHAEEPSAHRR